MSTVFVIVYVLAIITASMLMIRKIQIIIEAIERSITAKHRAKKVTNLLTAIIWLTALVVAMIKIEFYHAYNMAGVISVIALILAIIVALLLLVPKSWRVHIFKELIVAEFATMASLYSVVELAKMAIYS